jgi:hypothetical protein
LEKEKDAEEMSRRSHNYARFAKKMKPTFGAGSAVRGDMRGRSRRISRRSWGISKSVLACLAILGGAGLGGLAAGFNARAGLSSPQLASSTVVVAAKADMAPSDSVNLRFPADWADAEVEPVSKMLALASADSGIALFSPRPTYAYAATDADVPVMVEVTPKPPPPAAPAKVALASATAKPAKPRSNHVLNDSQIASIKKRLALTPEQERYWPAVEAELRKMEYSKKSPQGGSRMASIDMSKVNVEGLKSAGYPLVMSFSDDQRRELKSLAHLLGLESVMAGL